MNTPATPAEIQGAKAAFSRSYRCHECKAETALRNLNDDMLCEACGEPPEDHSDLTARERYGYGRPFNALREWGTW